MDPQDRLCASCKNPATHVNSYRTRRDDIVLIYYCFEHAPPTATPITADTPLSLRSK